MTGSLRLAVVSFALVSLMAPSASAQSKPRDASPLLLSQLPAPLGVSLRTAMAAAARRAPAARRRRAQAEEARADVHATTASLFPQARVEASYRRLSDVDNPPLGPDQPGFAVIQNQWSVATSLHWSLTNAVGAGLASLGAAEEALEARASAARASEEQAKLDAAEAYLDAVRAQARVQLAQRSQQRVARLEHDVGIQVRAGSARKSDLSSVRASLARTKGDLADAEAALSEANRRLARLTGLRAKKRRRLSLRRGLGPLPSYETALGRAERHRGELAEARALARATADSERATDLARLPEVSLEASYRYARPNPRITPPVDAWRSDWSLGVVLSWSPTALWTQAYQAKAARARTEQQEAYVDELRENIQQQVSSAHARGRSADAALPPAQAEVQAAQDAHRFKRRELSSGIASAREALETEVDLASAQTRFLDAFVESLRARLNLRFAQGLPLRDGSGAMNAPLNKRSR